MSLPPLYCSICAAPCLQPRTPLPLPSPGPGLTDSDTTDILLADININEGSTWEHEWYVVQTGKGVLSPSHTETLLATAPNSGAQKVRINPKTGRATATDSPKRAVPIHHYCLSALLGSLRGLSGRGGEGGAQGEEIMLKWNLPMWTGFGPWVASSPLSDKESMDWRHRMMGGAGCWAGTLSQRARYQPNLCDSHLREGDHVSPAVIPPPSEDRDIKRIPQTSSFLNLPPHIHLKIQHHLLPPQFHSPTRLKDIANPENPRLQPNQLHPEHCFIDFHNLLNTCSQMREIPSSTFLRLTTIDVEQFKHRLIQTWRSSPSGNGSANRLWYSLDEAFTDEITAAFAGIATLPSPIQDLSSAAGVTHQASRGYTAKDVWTWWMRDPAWRSRRRVWHCLVHAYSTARNADWW